MWMFHALAISAVRLTFEGLLFRRARHFETAPRFAALLHGAVCTVFLMNGQWDQAVEATGVFFVLDGLFNMIEDKLTWDMTLHHAMGAVLCLFSCANSSFNPPHVGADLTRALILLETTNPLLHFLVIARREKLEISKSLLKCLQFLFLVQFMFVRIVNLGRSLFVTWKMFQKLEHLEGVVTFIFGVSCVMWLLQFVWLRKLLMLSSSTQQA